MAERWDRGTADRDAVDHGIVTRDTGAEVAGARGPGDRKPLADPAAARRRAEQRETRVAAGVRELDSWLRDQVRQGLAASQRAGYLHWDDIAARMVDAQAPGLAERLRGLAAVPHSGAGWEGRLLEEYALLHLLAVACRDQGRLPPRLQATVRSRVGFTVRQADVLAGSTRVRDQWQVLARRDLDNDRIRTRRAWLRGKHTGRPALVLSFAPTGQPFDDSLPVGTETDADLAFYPAAVELRALVTARYDAAPADVVAGGPVPADTVPADTVPADTVPDSAVPRHGPASPPRGTTVPGLLAGYAVALAEDPWLDSWPAVLDVTPARAPLLCLRDADGAAIPLHPGAGDCWPLFALSGGRPLTVAGEWSPRGLWPLTAWDEDGRPVPL